MAAILGQEMKKSFLKVSTADGDYHAMVQYTNEEPVSLSIALVNGTEVWTGEGIWACPFDHRKFCLRLRSLLSQTQKYFSALK